MLAMPTANQRFYHSENNQFSSEKLIKFDPVTIEKTQLLFTYTSNEKHLMLLYPYHVTGLSRVYFVVGRLVDYD